MILLTLALLIAFAWWAPATAFGRLVNDASRRLCQTLATTRPLTFALFFVFATGLFALIAYGGGDGLHVAIPFGAEGLAFFASVDLGVAVDLFAAAWLLRGGQALKLLRAVIAVLRSRFSRPSRRVTRQPRRSRPRANNDDEPGGYWIETRLPAAA